MGYNTENGAILIINFRKTEDEIIVQTWEKGQKQTKTFAKITRVDEPEPSV